VFQPHKVPWQKNYLDFFQPCNVQNLVYKYEVHLIMSENHSKASFLKNEKNIFPFIKNALFVILYLLPWCTSFLKVNVNPTTFFLFFILSYIDNFLAWLWKWLNCNNQRTKKKSLWLTNQTVMMAFYLKSIN